MHNSFYKTPEEATLARHIIGLEEDDGKWHVIHSTWSTIRPMEVDLSKFGKPKDVV